MSRSPEFDVFLFWIFVSEINGHVLRSCGKHKKRNLRRRNRHSLTLSDLSIILKQSGRNIALSRLVALSISSLHNLDIEDNKFYVIPLFHTGP